MSRRSLKFLQFDSPWSSEPGIVRLPAPEGLGVDEVSRLLVSGELNRPYIFETASERCLHFTHVAVQSRMRLEEPDALVNEYTRKMMAFLLFNPQPRHIVMVGLGGGSIPKFCYRNLPETRITVVEIDADVIALRDEFCIPADDDRFRVVHADGARYIAQLSEPADVILIDAFDPEGVAPALAKSDFYAQAAANLEPQGVLVMNLSGRKDRFAAHIGRIREAFEGNAVLVPVHTDENFVLFAFKEPVLLTATTRYESRARSLERRFALEFPRYLRRISRGQVLA
jgi:spermidine synthase